MTFFGLFRRKPYERAGFELYTAAVKASRDPYFFQTLGVPDTLDGRFDMVGLYVFLVVHRLHAASEEGKQLAQAVFDAMFSDMDINLREIGISDMTVGKKVRAMWEAFNGRSAAYGAAVQADDPEALATAIARNVWRGPSNSSSDTTHTWVSRADSSPSASMTPPTRRILNAHRTACTAGTPSRAATAASSAALATTTTDAPCGPTRSNATRRCTSGVMLRPAPGAGSPPGP